MSTYRNTVVVVQIVRSKFAKQCRGTNAIVLICGDESSERSYIRLTRWKIAFCSACGELSEACTRDCMDAIQAVKQHTISVCAVDDM